VHHAHGAGESIVDGVEAEVHRLLLAGDLAFESDDVD